MNKRGIGKMSVQKKKRKENFQVLLGDPKEDTPLSHAKPSCALGRKTWLPKVGIFFSKLIY